MKRKKTHIENSTRINVWTDEKSSGISIWRKLICIADEYDLHIEFEFNWIKMFFVDEFSVDKWRKTFSKSIDDSTDTNDK